MLLSFGKTTYSLALALQYLLLQKSSYCWFSYKIIPVISFPGKYHSWEYKGILSAILTTLFQQLAHNSYFYCNSTRYFYCRGKQPFLWYAFFSTFCSQKSSFMIPLRNFTSYFFPWVALFLWIQEYFLEYWMSILKQNLSLLG